MMSPDYEGNGFGHCNRMQKNNEQEVEISAQMLHVWCILSNHVVFPKIIKYIHEAQCLLD